LTKPKQPWRCQKCGCTGLGTIPRANARSKICAWCADELAKAGQRWCTTGRHATANWASTTATMCRDCQKAQNQAYRALHREELIAASLDYHAAHRDEILAANKIRYQENRDHLLAQKKVYYQERRELIKAKVRAYRPKRPQASRERERERRRIKGPIYWQNAKLAQRRRWLASLRGAM